MAANGLLQALCSALCLAGALGCSSDPPATDAGTDVGFADNGGFVDDVPVFTGMGNLSVTWTINGNPPATECAVVGAAFVEIQASFGAATRLPCTQGMFSKMMLGANRLNVGARLLRADGTPIYEYVIPTTIVANQDNQASINFEPPGSLRVSWTVNDLSPSAECPNTTATTVVVRAEGLDGFQAPCSTGRVTFTRVPSARLTGLQPGHYAVTGEIRSGTGSNSRTIQTVTGEGDVPSGGVGTIVLGFTAPPRPVDE
ncbi:MAG: hypothetical protein JWM10_4525 [Myxococcaceae bacterium]|nr:hypothetical protein [Myxococcaceae bacterium]